MDIDVIKVNVPTFIRLLELAREDLKNDADIHFLAEKATEISKRKTIAMSDYCDMVAVLAKK